ncbi:hypothetical protein B10172_07700 [Campylobacter jejuni]|nr:hypothetical protein B10172_07700 [Campylobacter jejuni]
MHEFFGPRSNKKQIKFKSLSLLYRLLFNEIPEGSYFPMQTMHRGDELNEALYNTYFFKR